MKFLFEDDIRMRYENARDDVSRLLEIYPLNIPNELIDPIVTGISLKHGLSPMSLQIHETVDFAVPGDDRAAGSYEGEAAADGFPAVFRVAGASVALRGDFGSFKNLLQEIAETEYLRLSGFAFSAESRYDRESVITAALDIYMMSDLENRE
jgi:hypothetical protein